jgi:hypothetical protein
MCVPAEWNSAAQVGLGPGSRPGLGEVSADELRSLFEHDWLPRPLL